jgi:hypothetical protein
MGSLFIYFKNIGILRNVSQGRQGMAPTPKLDKESKKCGVYQLMNLES